MIWRPVLEGLDTLTNVKQAWTLDDLLDAHDALDAKADMESEMMRRAREGAAR